MPTELPAGLQEALRVVGGQAWPEGDEDGLNRIADAWKKVASDIVVLRDAMQTSAADVSRDMRGDFANAYRNYAETKVEDSLFKLKQSAQELSDLARNTAADIQAAKISICVQLGFVALAIATTFIPIIGGLISGGIVATVRFAIGQIIKGVVMNIANNGVKSVATNVAKNIAASVVKNVTVSSAKAAATNVAKNVAVNGVIGEGLAMAIEGGTQLGQIASGQRTDWNEDRLKGAAISGAFGGVGGGVAQSAADGLGKAAAQGAFGEAVKEGMKSATGQVTGATINAGLQGVGGYAGEKAADAAQRHDQANSYSFTSAMAGGFGKLGGGKAGHISEQQAHDVAKAGETAGKAADATAVGSVKTETLGPDSNAETTSVKTESSGLANTSGGSPATGTGEELPAYTGSTLPGYAEQGAGNDAGNTASHTETVAQQQTSGVSGGSGQQTAAEAGQTTVEQAQVTTEKQQPVTESGTDKFSSASTTSDGTSQSGTDAGTTTDGLQAVSSDLDQKAASEISNVAQGLSDVQHQGVGAHLDTGLDQGTGSEHAGQVQTATQHVGTAQEHDAAGDQGVSSEGVGQQTGSQHQETATQHGNSQHDASNQLRQEIFGEQGTATHQVELPQEAGSQHQDGSSQHQTPTPTEQPPGTTKQVTSHTTEHEVETRATHTEYGQPGTPVHSTEAVATKQETTGGTATKSTVQSSSDISSSHSSTETASSHAAQTLAISGESTQKPGTTPSTAQHETLAPTLDSTPKQETRATPPEHSTEQANTTQQTTPPVMLLLPDQPTANHSAANQPTGQPTGQRGPAPTTSPTNVPQRPATTSTGVSHTASQGSSHTPATESRPTTSTAQGQKPATTAAATTGDTRPANTSSGPLSEKAMGKQPMRSTQSSSDHVGGSSSFGPSRPVEVGGFGADWRGALREAFGRELTDEQYAALQKYAHAREARDVLEANPARSAAGGSQNAPSLLQSASEADARLADAQQQLDAVEHGLRQLLPDLNQDVLYAHYQNERAKYYAKFGRAPGGSPWPVGDQSVAPGQLTGPPGGEAGSSNYTAQSTSDGGTLAGQAPTRNTRNWRVPASGTPRRIALEQAVATARELGMKTTDIEKQYNIADSTASLLSSAGGYRKHAAGSGRSSVFDVQSRALLAERLGRAPDAVSSAELRAWQEYVSARVDRDVWQVLRDQAGRFGADVERDSAALRLGEAQMRLDNAASGLGGFVPDPAGLYQNYLDKRGADVVLSSTSKRTVPDDLADTGRKCQERWEPSADVVGKIVDDYVIRGKSLQQLGREHGRDMGSVRRILKHEKVQIRSVSEQRVLDGQRSYAVRSEFAEAQRLPGFDRDSAVRAIAEKHGFPTDYIERVLKVGKQSWSQEQLGAFLEHDQGDFLVSGSNEVSSQVGPSAGEQQGPALATGADEVDVSASHQQIDEAGSEYRSETQHSEHRPSRNPAGPTDMQGIVSSAHDGRSDGVGLGQGSVGSGGLWSQEQLGAFLEQDQGDFLVSGSNEVSSQVGPLAGEQQGPALVERRPGERYGAVPAGQLELGADAGHRSPQQVDAGAFAEDVVMAEDGLATGADEVDVSASHQQIDEAGSEYRSETQHSEHRPSRNPAGPTDMQGIVSSAHDGRSDGVGLGQGSVGSGGLWSQEQLGAFLEQDQGDFLVSGSNEVSSQVGPLAGEQQGPALVERRPGERYGAVPAGQLELGADAGHRSPQQVDAGAFAEDVVMAEDGLATGADEVDVSASHQQIDEAGSEYRSETQHSEHRPSRNPAGPTDMQGSAVRFEHVSGEHVSYMKRGTEARADFAAEIGAKYEAGWKVSELSKQYKISEMKIYGLLDDAGIKRTRFRSAPSTEGATAGAGSRKRPRAKTSAHLPPKGTVERLDLAKKVSADKHKGASWRDLADKYEISERSLQRLVDGVQKQGFQVESEAQFVEDAPASGGSSSFGPDQPMEIGDFGEHWRAALRKAFGREFTDEQYAASQNYAHAREMRDVLAANPARSAVGGSQNVQSLLQSAREADAELADAQEQLDTAKHQLQELLPDLDQDALYIDHQNERAKYYASRGRAPGGSPWPVGSQSVDAGQLTGAPGGEAGSSNYAAQSTLDTAANHQLDYVSIDMGTDAIELQELHHDTAPPASPETQHKQDLVATNLVKASDVDGTRLRADLDSAMTELGVDERTRNAFKAAFSDVQLKDDFTTLSEEGVTKSIGHGPEAVEVTVRTRLVGEESPVAGPVPGESQHEVETSGDYGKTSDESASTVRREKGVDLTGMFGLGTTNPMGAVEAGGSVKASAVPGWKFGTDSALQHSAEFELSANTRSTRHDLRYEITVTCHDGTSTTRSGTQESGVELTTPESLRTATEPTPATEARVPHPQHVHTAHVRGDNGLFGKITGALPENSPLRREIGTVGSTARGQLREAVSGGGLSLRAGDLLGGRTITKTLQYEHLGQTRTANVHITARPHSPTRLDASDVTVTDRSGAKTEHAASELTKQSTDVRFGGGALVAIPRAQDASFAAGARGDVNVQAKVGGTGSDEHTAKNTTGVASASEHSGSLRAYRTALDYDVHVDFDDGNSVHVGAHTVESGATVWMSPEHAAANGWDSPVQHAESSGTRSNAPELSTITPLSVFGSRIEFGGVDQMATELHQILDGDSLPPHDGLGHQPPHISKNVDRINALITPDSFAAHGADLVGDGWSFVLPRETHLGTSTGTEHVWVRIRAIPGRYEASPVPLPDGGELKGELTASALDEHTAKTKGNWLGTGGFGGVIPTDPNFPLRTAQISGSYTRKIGDFERTVTVTAGHENTSSWQTGTRYQNTQRVHYHIEVFGPNGRIGERSFAADATSEVPVGSRPPGGQAGEPPSTPAAEFRDHNSSTPLRPNGWKQAALSDDYAVHSLNLPHGMAEKLMREIKAFDGLGDDAAANDPLGHLGEDGVIAANRVHTFAGPTEVGANLDRAVTGTYHAQVERYRQGELVTGYSNSLGEAAMNLSLSNAKVIDYAESVSLELTAKNQGSTTRSEFAKTASDTSLDGRSNARLNQTATTVPQWTHTTAEESGAGNAASHAHESAKTRTYRGPGYLVSFDASIVLSGRNTEHAVALVGDSYSKSQWTHSQVDASDTIRVWVPADQIHQIGSDIEWHVERPQHDDAPLQVEGGQFTEPDYAKLGDGWVNVRPEVTRNLVSGLAGALGTLTHDQLPEAVRTSFVATLYHSAANLVSSAYSWLMDPSAGRLDSMVHSRLLPALAPSGLSALHADIVGGGLRTTYHYVGPLGRSDIMITIKGTEKPGRVEGVSDHWTLSEESKSTGKLTEQRTTATTHTEQGQAVFSVFPEGQIQRNPGTAAVGEISHKSQVTVEDSTSTETTHTSERTGRTVAFVHDLDLTITIEKTSGWGRLPQSLSFGVLDRLFPATTAEPIKVDVEISDAVRRLVPESDSLGLEQLHNSGIQSTVDWAAPKHELSSGSRAIVRATGVRAEIDALLAGGLGAGSEGSPAPSLSAGATDTRHWISAMTTQSALSADLAAAMSEGGYRIEGLDADRYFEAGALNHGQLKSLTLHAELRNPKITAAQEGSLFDSKQTSSSALKVEQSKTLAGGTAVRIGMGGLLWNANPAGPGPGQIGRMAGEFAIKGPAAQKVVTDTSEVGGKTAEQEHSLVGKTYLVTSDATWSITPEYRGSNVPEHWTDPRVVREPGGAVFWTDEAGLRSLGLEPPELHAESQPLPHEETAAEDGATSQDSDDAVHEENKADGGEQPHEVEDGSSDQQQPVEHDSGVVAESAGQPSLISDSSDAASTSMSDFLAPQRADDASTGQPHADESPQHQVDHGPEEHTAESTAEHQSQSNKGKQSWNPAQDADSTRSDEAPATSDHGGLVEAETGDAAWHQYLETLGREHPSEAGAPATKAAAWAAYVTAMAKQNLAAYDPALRGVGGSHTAPIEMARAQRSVAQAETDLAAAERGMRAWGLDPHTLLAEWEATRQNHGDVLPTGSSSVPDEPQGPAERTEQVPGTDHVLTTTLHGSRAGEYVLSDRDGTVLVQRFNLFEQGEAAGYVAVDHRGGSPTAWLFAADDANPVELGYSEANHDFGATFRLTELATGDFREYDLATRTVVHQYFGLRGQETFGGMWHDLRTGQVIVTDGLGRAHVGLGRKQTNGNIYVKLPDGDFVADPGNGAVVAQYLSDAVHLGTPSEHPRPFWADGHDIDVEPAERWQPAFVDPHGRFTQLSADSRWWRFVDPQGHVTLSQVVRPGEQTKLVGKLVRTIEAVEDGGPPEIHVKYEWYRVDLGTPEAPATAFVGVSDAGASHPLWQHEPTAAPEFDPLQAAVQRPSEATQIVPSPLWRADLDLLRRFDHRPFETIFEEGFAPLRPENSWPLGNGRSTEIDLVTYSAQNHVRSMFVSTTRWPEGIEDHPGTLYDIDAPGGVDVNATLGAASRYPEESEIAFPGGLRRQFIMGAETPDEPEWYLVNKHYDPLGPAAPLFGEPPIIQLENLVTSEGPAKPSTGIEAWEQYVRARAEVDRWTNDPAWQEVGESSSGSVAKQRAQQELDAARARLREAEQNLRSMGVEHPDATLAEQRARQAEDRAGRDAAGHPGGGASWSTPDQRFHVQTDENTGATLTTTLHGRQAGEFALRDANGLVLQQRMNLLDAGKESMGHVVMDRRPGMNEAVHYLPDGTTRTLRWEPLSQTEFRLVEADSGDYLRFDAPTRTLVEQRSGIFHEPNPESVQEQNVPQAESAQSSTTDGSDRQPDSARNDHTARNERTQFPDKHEAKLRGGSRDAWQPPGGSGHDATGAPAESSVSRSPQHTDMEVDLVPAYAKVDDLSRYGLADGDAEAFDSLFNSEDFASSEYAIGNWTIRGQSIDDIHFWGAVSQDGRWIGVVSDQPGYSVWHWYEQDKGLVTTSLFSIGGPAKAELVKLENSSSNTSSTPPIPPTAASSSDPTPDASSTSVNPGEQHDDPDSDPVAVMGTDQHGLQCPPFGGEKNHLLHPVDASGGFVQTEPGITAYRWLDEHPALALDYGLLPRDASRSDSLKFHVNGLGYTQFVSTTIDPRYHHNDRRYRYEIHASQPGIDVRKTFGARDIDWFALEREKEVAFLGPISPKDIVEVIEMVRGDHGWEKHVVWTAKGDTTDTDPTTPNQRPAIRNLRAGSDEEAMTLAKDVVEMEVLAYQAERRATRSVFMVDESQLPKFREELADAFRGGDGEKIDQLRMQLRNALYGKRTVAAESLQGVGMESKRARLPGAGQIESKAALQEVVEHGEPSHQQAAESSAAAAKAESLSDSLALKQEDGGSSGGHGSQEVMSEKRRGKLPWTQVHGGSEHGLGGDPATESAGHGTDVDSSPRRTDPGTDAATKSTTDATGSLSEAEHEAIDALADLGLDPQRVAEIRAEFVDLAATGHLEDHSSHLAANPGIREALQVIHANLDRIPEPGRARVRAWVADAVLATSLVPVRETAPAGLAGLDHAAVRQRFAVRALTPDRLETALAEIAKNLESWSDPFETDFSSLQHTDYQPEAGLPQRLAQLSLANLTPQARPKLRDSDLYQRLLGDEDALVDSMFAAGGHDTQHFLCTCTAAALNAEVLGKVPTTAGLLLVARNLADQVAQRIADPAKERAHLLDERDQLFGRTIRELVSDRVQEARREFDDIERRALELIDSGRRDPGAWADFNQRWGRSMQKLSVVMDPSQGPDSIPVLTNALFPGHWGWSVGISALLMVLDRPFRRFAGMDGQAMAEALRKTLHHDGRIRQVEFAKWVDEAGAAQAWQRVHRSGGVLLQTATHTLWLEAVQRDGQQAFLLHDPKKSHPDHYGPQAMLDRAGRSKMVAELVDPPFRPYEDSGSPQLTGRKSQRSTSDNLSAVAERSDSGADSTHITTGSPEEPGGSGHTPAQQLAEHSDGASESEPQSTEQSDGMQEQPPVEHTAGIPEVDVAAELAAFGLDEQRLEQVRAELREWVGDGRVEDYTADILSQPELGLALREIRANLDSVPGLDVARLKALVADAALVAALVPVRDGVIPGSAHRGTVTRNERLAVQPLSLPGLHELLTDIANVTSEGKDPFRARESLLRHSDYQPKQRASRRLTQLSLVNLNPHVRQQLVHDALFQQLLGSETALDNALFGVAGDSWRDLLAEHGLSAGTMPTAGGLLQVGRAVLRHLDDELAALTVQVSQTPAGRPRGGSGVDEFVRSKLAEARAAFDEIEQIAQDSFDSIEQTALAFIRSESDGNPVHHEQWAELTRAWSGTMRAMLTWDGPALDGLRGALSQAATGGGTREPVRVNSETDPAGLWERMLRCGGAVQARIGVDRQPLLIRVVRQGEERLFTIVDAESGEAQQLGLEAFTGWAQERDAVVTVPVESTTGQDAGTSDVDPVTQENNPDSGSSESSGETDTADDAEEPPRSMPTRDAAPASWTTAEYRWFGTDPVSTGPGGSTTKQRLVNGPFVHRAPEQMIDGGDQSFPRFLAARPALVDEHPPVRISGDGTLAIAAHGHGAKEVFATLEVVRRAQADLDRVGGAVRLRVDESSGIEFESGGRTKRLYRVLPDFGDGGVSDISKEFTRDVLGASPTHAVLYDTRPSGAGGTGKLATAQINTTSDKEISGTHELADALVSAAAEPELAAPEWAAGQVRRGWDQQEHDSPTPGEGYGRAFSRTGSGSSAVAAKLGINEHARPRVGEGYLIQPISHGTDDDGGRRFSLDFSGSDEGRRVERMRFYRFAPVVLESADGQHHIVLENTRRREADNRFLRTVLEKNIIHYATRVHELEQVLAEATTNEGTGPRALFADSLLKVIEHQQQLAELGDQDPAQIEGELAAAKGNAVRALSALSGEEFGTSGDQWWFEMFGRAPGESLFESDSHLGEKPNALVLTVIPDHDDKRMQVEFGAGSTQLDELATAQTQRFISKLAGNAAWLAKQGAPLPQVHITVESLPDELGAREQRSAAVVQELRKHAAALGLDVGTMPVVIEHRVRDVEALRAQRSEFGFDDDEPIRTAVRVHAQLSGPGADKPDPTPQELAELARTTGLHRAQTPLGKYLGKHTEVTTEEIDRMREIVRTARQLDPDRGDDPDWLTSVRRISDLQQRSGAADLDALVRQVFGLADDAEVHPWERRQLADLVPHAKRSGRPVALSDLINARKAHQWPTPAPPPEPVPNEIAF
ncbi:scabin-related ADP-ribosyltransferase [Saccharopolyspora elongata]|uniref:Uncharacterized protein n=1 Tax=Saccharopolyspora elongata TaxID=2530387 RepID=A0A4R4YC74_9PSEU|nr:hypothetical protein [Saccharopolyspora elongata]TDD42211.1 hypothetical protein E1288_30250 [Saccharopolyspora elongata]